MYHASSIILMSDRVNNVSLSVNVVPLAFPMKNAYVLNPNSASTLKLKMSISYAIINYNYHITSTLSHQ